MPPVENIEEAIFSILRPFEENGEDEGGRRPSNTFWDYWSIGGRWSGDKLIGQIDPSQLQSFYDALNEQKITVSGLRMGKPTLKPADQQEAVDALWNKFFPSSPLKVCPLFDHYQGDLGDVMTLGDAPRLLKCSHVIIAGPKSVEGGLEATYMVQESIWNGVIYCKTNWDGTLGGALDAHLEHMMHWKDDYRQKHTPKDDWLVVTVDYHS